jgi:hypothetical protein
MFEWDVSFDQSQFTILLRGYNTVNIGCTIHLFLQPGSTTVPGTGNNSAILLPVVEYLVLEYLSALE